MILAKLLPRAEGHAAADHQIRMEGQREADLGQVGEVEAVQRDSVAGEGQLAARVVKAAMDESDLRTGARGPAVSAAA